MSGFLQLAWDVLAEGTRVQKQTLLSTEVARLCANDDAM